MILEYPVTEGDQEITEITLKRPTLGDCMAAEGKGKLEEIAILISRCGSVPMSVVKKLDTADFTKLADEVNRFLPRSPETGET